MPALVRTGTRGFLGPVGMYVAVLRREGGKLLKTSRKTNSQLFFPFARMGERVNPKQQFYGT